MDTDDIYGNDLLGGTVDPPSDTQNQPLGATTLDVSSMSPDELKTALQEWHTTFEEERQEGGIFSGIAGPIQPLTVLNELRRALSSEQQARAESTALRQRLAGAAAEAAARVQEDILLRKELLAARASTDPSILQLRRLLLEPVVNREFERLSQATAAATLEATNLKNDIRLLHDIGNNPNGPRALAAKVRSLEEQYAALQQVNEEGEKESIERALTTAKAQLEEMRHKYGELEYHKQSLEEEIEGLQRDLVNAERRLSAVSSGDRGGPPPYHQQQQQGGWGRGHPMQHQQPPPPLGGGGGGGYYNRGGPPGQQQQGMGGGGGGGGGGSKRPRDY